MYAFRIADMPLFFQNAASLGDVRRYFLERSIDTSMAIEWLIGFCVLIAVLLALILFLAIRNKRRVYVPDDWIVDPRAIRDTLQLAMDQRARFELQFQALQGGRRPALRCSGVRLEGLFLTLEISGLQTLSSRWDGKEADCFFQVLGQGQVLYHAFVTRVKDVSTQGDRCFLRISIPDRIESRQKRSYLRIAPPEEYLLGAALWHGTNLPDDDTRDNLQQWAKPSLLFIPTVSPQFFVTDVSAGGVRVHIPRESLSEDIKQINVSDRVVFMVDLWDPDKAQRLRFWMLGRVQSPTLDFQSRGMDVGVQFLAWAKPREGSDSGGELEWLRLSHSGEVEPLGNWIMRRHLELFREGD
ncbi:hypothetical protein LJC23_01950 [Desulfovibrio sp. OttesenSCG-928-I05]|nr:hypothetical protein [Desulfovibrio sp. OttesenSCG-928-I05]